MMNVNTNFNAVQNAIKSNLENNRIQQKTNPEITKTTGEEFSNTVKSIEDLLRDTDEIQQSSDVSIKDLLAGKNSDITSVVSEVAKADVSFKLLVGVRNKLIEAYKQTMNMPI
jgi:flagellar hook-basal body complex protein FliE